MAGLGTVYTDERSIFCRVEAFPVAVGTEASGWGSCVVRLRLCSIGEAAADILSMGRENGGEARMVFESWLPKAVGQNHSRQESEGYLRRRRSDDGSEKISGSTRHEERSALRRRRCPMGRRRVARMTNQEERQRSRRLDRCWEAVWRQYLE